MVRERTSMAQPLLGSFLLHGGLAVALLISWDWLSRPVRMEASVPVTLVAEAPVSNIRPAVEAPVEAPPATEDPVPDATPEPAAPPVPEPAPVPQSPPKPAPKQPKPKPAPTPSPKKPAPAKAAPSLDLDALADSLKPNRPKPKSSAAKGRPRPETARQARASAGEANALASSALADLGADLRRLWNPNCAVEGGSDVNIRATFELDGAGRVTRTRDANGNMVPDISVSGQGLGDPVVQAAVDRAKRAIVRREPFLDLPAELYRERIAVRFDARTACASG